MRHVLVVVDLQEFEHFQRRALVSEDPLALFDTLQSALSDPEYDRIIATAWPYPFAPGLGTAQDRLNHAYDRSRKVHIATHRPSEVYLNRWAEPHVGAILRLVIELAPAIVTVGGFWCNPGCQYESEVCAMGRALRGALTRARMRKTLVRIDERMCAMEHSARYPEPYMWVDDV